MIKKFDDFNKTNEEALWDDEASNKTLAGWTQAFVTKEEINKKIIVKKPFEIEFTNNSDYTKLAYILQKYRVDFKEIDLK